MVWVSATEDPSKEVSRSKHRRRDRGEDERHPPRLRRYPVAGRLADRVGRPRVAVLGTGITALGAMWFGAVPGLIWPVVLMFFLGVFDTYGFIATRVTFSRSVPE